MAIIDIIAQKEDAKVGPVGSILYNVDGAIPSYGNFQCTGSASFRLREAVAAQTTFSLHTRFYDADGGGGDGSYRIRWIDTASGNAQVDLTRGSASNKLRVRRRVSGTMTNLVEFVLPLTTWVSLVIVYTYHASTGSVNVYVDDVLVGSYTGDTTFDAGTWNDMIAAPSGGDNYYLAEIILATTSTIGMRVGVLNPNGTGTHTDWSGSYTDIDEYDYSDADYMSTSSAGQSMTSVLADTPTILTGKNVVHVRLTGAVFSAGTLDVKPLLRIGGTTYEGAAISLVAGMNKISADYSVSPATSGAFTVSEVNGMEAGFKSV